MANIPNNFPTGSTNEEIAQVIQELFAEILRAGGNINDVMRLTPLINVGQSELQNRGIERLTRAISEVESAVQDVEFENTRVSQAIQELEDTTRIVGEEARNNTLATKKLINITRDLKTITSNAVKSSDTNGLISRFLAIISLAVLALSIPATIYFSWQSSHSTDSIAKQQLQELKVENTNLQLLVKQTVK